MDIYGVKYHSDVRSINGIRREIMDRAVPSRFFKVIPIAGGRSADKFMVYCDGHRCGIMYANPLFKCFTYHLKDKTYKVNADGSLGKLVASGII